ncbi:hypothetical protein FS842_003099 [Serendipita sp. 407]|nr:hypothetical protein FS842_003099 [Serendipita sp. 407]
MVISAGNSGSVGPWYSSSPASGIDVITVASTDSTTVYYQRANVSTGYGPIVYTGFESLPVNGSWPIYAISNVTTITNDACNPLPDSTPDLSPYVVIIRRGTCAFTQKLANAAAKGMRVALVYNNGGSFQGLAAGNYTAALISEQDGAYLVSQFVAGNNITISFPQGSAQPIPFPQGGLISTFSSYGPNYDLYLKPSIAAPGGGILSSIPSGKYAIYSGTSMAAPYISGSAALALEAHGVSRDTGKTIRTLFEATASHLGSTHDETAPYETLIRQGSGLVQVYNAIRYNTIVDRPEILLNDSVHFDHKYPIGFQNTGNTTLSYTIGHIPAGTATTFNTSLSLPISGAAPLSTTTATLSFSQTTFTLGPGKKTKITVTVEPPSGLDPKSFPIYSGWITATGSNGEVVSVPYMGLAASVKDMNVLDRSDYYFGIPLPALLDAKEDPQTDLQNYTFANDNNPTLLWRQAAGTAVQRIDLVDAASNVTFTKRSPGSFAAVPILGTLQEKAYVPRNSLINVSFFDG